MYRSILKRRMSSPPPGQTHGHLTFLKNFGQIPWYLGSLAGQMPHRLALQKGANPSPTSEYRKNFPMRQNRLFNLNILLNATELSEVS